MQLLIPQPSCPWLGLKYLRSVLKKMEWIVVLIAICLFGFIEGGLEKCSDVQNEVKIEICLIEGQDRYVEPTPAVLDTTFYLNQIIKIDGKDNFISIHVNLVTSWTDPRIALSSGNV